MSTERVERMINSSPYYYHYSRVYESIQAAQGSEYDTVDAKNKDLRLQLYITTATWGLKYWEETLGLLTVESDSYEIRRTRVLAAWRGIGNFSADQISGIAKAFSNGEVSVVFNIATSVITITFTGTMGVPPNVDDLKAAIDNVVHAHLGVEYKYTYALVGEVAVLTVAQAAAMTVGDLLVYRP